MMGASRTVIRMGRIRSAFEAARSEGRAALVPFIAAGDPDMDATVTLARAAADAGADIVELGVPYSDPLADGPVIQAAYTRALAAGATLDALFRAVERIAASTDIPLLLMTSISPVMARGLDRFCGDAAAAGAAGVLVPDLLPEDAAELVQSAGERGLETVFLTVPWATDERVRAAAKASSGFLYLVSRRGVTGERHERGSGGPADRERGGDRESGSDRSDGLTEAVARARSCTELPVAVGFGVAGPKDAARVAAAADGVVVGSALVRAIHEAVTQGRDPVEVARERIAALRRAVERAE